MRLISLFFIVVIVLLIMWFLTQNVDQVVEELEIFQYSFFNVYLVNIIFGTFAFGVIMGFLIPVIQYISAKGEVRNLKKEVKTCNCSACPVILRGRSGIPLPHFWSMSRRFFARPSLRMT